MKPKILIIGNKEVDFPISDEKLKFINSFDIIVRVNRMNNFFETGQRVDWWWLDHNIKKFKFDSKIVTEVKRIILNAATVRVFGLSETKNDELDIVKLKKLFPNLQYNCEIIKNPNYDNCNICERNKYWVVSKELKTIPTTFIICVSHIVDEYADTYDIYFTCTDLEGRSELYKTNKNWSTSWHRNVGKYEEDYLKLMIKKGKIKYLEIENHDKDIHNS